AEKWSVQFVVDGGGTSPERGNAPPTDAGQVAPPRSFVSHCSPGSMWPLPQRGAVVAELVVVLVDVVLLDVEPMVELVDELVLVRSEERSVEAVKFSGQFGLHVGNAPVAEPGNR